MNKFFSTPFAATGDKTTVQNDAAPDGSVSYAEGYGYDYQRAKTDANAKDIERDKLNQLFNDVTTALAELQTQGFPDFITSALNGGIPYPYAINAAVRFEGVNYLSLVGANATDPSSSPSSWAALEAGGPPPAVTNPAFSAPLSIGTLASGAFALAQLSTPSFDFTGAVSTSGDRFTAAVEGAYLFSGSVLFSSSSTILGTPGGVVKIYRNGVEPFINVGITRFSNGSVVNQSINFSAVLQAVSPGDYFQVFVTHDTGLTDMAVIGYFSGTKVA